MDDFKEEAGLIADISTCDLEPIHTPGRVQPFGALLATPTDLSRITHCSANSQIYLGQPPELLLHKPVADLLPGEAVHDIRNTIGASTASTQRERVGSYQLDTGVFEVYAHLNADGQAVIELEPAPENDDESYPVDQMRKLLAAAHAGSSIDQLLRVSVRGIQALIGYDRVMAYRYERNGDGEVVAEATNANVESFLGLRYPAWDVPEQARALQVKNPLRMLVDIKQKPVPILSIQDQTEPLNMALAHLRGISPIHVEYLENMGVGASLTIGLVVNGRLWGMFSCHHMSPKIISSDLRIAVELYGQVISLLIKEKQDAATVAKRRGRRGA